MSTLTRNVLLISCGITVRRLTCRFSGRGSSAFLTSQWWRAGHDPKMRLRKSEDGDNHGTPGCGFGQMKGLVWDTDPHSKRVHLPVTGR